MNIFILDNDPIQAAKYHNNKHVVKMILESSQMLSYAHHFYESKYKDVVYKPTHIGHPCTQWVIKSKYNYNYLLKLLLALHYEYTHRYKKIHKSSRLIEYFMENPVTQGTEMTPFVQAMKNIYKDTDTVTAYRRYYCAEKIGFSKYTNRPWPEWLKENAIQI